MAPVNSMHFSLDFTGDTKTGNVTYQNWNKDNNLHKLETNEEWDGEFSTEGQEKLQEGIRLGKIQFTEEQPYKNIPISSAQASFKKKSNSIDTNSAGLQMVSAGKDLL
jgi:hypothetical protein